MEGIAESLNYMANPKEDIYSVDGEIICVLIRYGFIETRNPSSNIFYRNYISKYKQEPVDAKINECNASLSKKKRDIFSREFLPNYRIQQILKDKVEHFR